jgi:hypothetical protein
MATAVYRPLKVVAFNVNDIGRQRYGLIRSCKNYTCMWLCSLRHV